MTEKPTTPRRSTTGRAPGITERDRKVGFFCGVAIDANTHDEGEKGKDAVRCVHQFKFTSPTALANELGLGKRLTETAGCSFDTQDKLAEYFGFDRTWPEWGSGTAHAFALRYNQDNTYQQPQPVVHIASERQLGLRLRTERMSLEPNEHQPNLASIDLFLQQANAGAPWPVSFDLVCQPTPVSNFEIAVKRGQVELDPGAAELPGARHRLGGNGPVVFKLQNPAREITIEVANARSGQASWDVSCRGKAIGVFQLDEEKALCAIEDIAPNDAIKISFNAYVKDLQLADPDPDDDDTDEGSGTYSFLRPDGKNLSPVKRNLIKAMLIKNELSPQASGFVEIAADRRAFMEDAGDE